MAEKVHRSRISNTEWGLAIGMLAMIDLVQAILTAIGIGVVLNRGISFVVGMAWPFYLQVRGEKMSDPKRLLGFLGVFGIEFFVPVIDALPLWTLDGFYNMGLAKLRYKAASKQQAGAAKLEKQKEIEAQAIQNEKKMAYRERQQRGDEEREAERIQAQSDTERNMINDDDEGVDEKRA